MGKQRWWFFVTLVWNIFSSFSIKIDVSLNDWNRFMMVFWQYTGEQGLTECSITTIERLHNEKDGKLVWFWPLTPMNKGFGVILSFWPDVSNDAIEKSQLNHLVRVFREPQYNYHVNTTNHPYLCLLIYFLFNYNFT